LTAFTDHERRLRTPWRIAIFLAGIIGVEIGGAVVVGIGVAALLVIAGKNLRVLQTPDARVWALIVAAFPIAALTLGVVWFCRRVLDRRSMRSLGLGRPRASALTGFASGLGLITLPAGVLIGIGGYRFVGISASLQTAALVPTLLVAAFQEEIVCRGYILQNIIDVRRPTTAVLVSSVVFWLFHSFNEAVWSSPLPSINLLLAGVLLALAYRVGGDIWFPTTLHFGWNLGQGVLLQLPISGVRTDGLLDLELTGRLPVWVTGGAFGLESSAVVASVQLLAVVALARILGKQPKSDRPVVDSPPPDILPPPAPEASPPPAAGRSPWLYAAMGCAVLAALGLVLAGGAVFTLGRSMRQWQADLKDPAAQEARARRLLGTTELPEGYPAVMSASVPYVFEVVLLAELRSGAGGRSRLGQHGFLYTKTPWSQPGDGGELREVIDGRRRQARLLMQEHIAVDGSVLSHGHLSAAGASITYAVQRGEFGYAWLVHSGLHALLLIECPSDTSARVGVWFTSETAGTQASPPALAGSPADEAALHTFLDHFRFCD
jgi:membrane protease YdiL (CAAX protease family)